MRRMAATLVALALSVALALPGPARAQGLTDPDCFPFAPGCDRLPRLLDDLAEQFAPLMEEFAGRLDPYLAELQQLLGDLSGWEAPEILPNGDILIRRRPAPPPDQVPEDEADPPSATEPFEL